jgi:hypothetical protein
VRLFKRKSLQDKKVTPEQVSAIFLRLTQWSPEREFTLERVEFDPNDVERVKKEFRLLWAFVIDFTVTGLLRDTPEREAIIGNLYPALDSDGLPIEEVTARLPAYWDIGNDADVKAVGERAALVFAEACGKPNDKKYVTAAQIEFVMMGNSIVNSLEQWGFVAKQNDQT